MLKRWLTLPGWARLLLYAGLTLLLWLILGDTGVYVALGLMIVLTLLGYRLRAREEAAGESNGSRLSRR